MTKRTRRLGTAPRLSQATIRSHPEKIQRGRQNEYALKTLPLGFASIRKPRTRSKQMSDLWAHWIGSDDTLGALSIIRKAFRWYTWISGFFDYFFLFGCFLAPPFAAGAVGSGKNPPTRSASRATLDMCLNRSPCSIIPPYHLLTTTITFLRS